MPITLQRRIRKGTSTNTVYGLEYRMVAIPKAAADQLKDLKERSGRPITELLTLAVEHFLQNVTVE